MADLKALRDGTFAELRLSSMQGIITFPSYHAGLSLVSLWGFWASRMAWLRWPGMTLAALTIAATPVDGGHYLVDVLAGVAIAAVSVAAAVRAVRWTPALPRFTASPSRHSHAASARNVPRLLRRQIDRRGADILAAAHRPIGIRDRMLSRCWSFKASVIAEVMKPGATQLTVMPRRRELMRHRLRQADQPGFRGDVIRLARIAGHRRPPRSPR